MELNRIDPKTIMGSGRIQNYISYFMNDHSEAVEIVHWQNEYLDGNSLYKSFRSAINRLSLSDKVRIVRRKNHFYLVKIKEDK